MKRVVKELAVPRPFTRRDVLKIWWATFGVLADGSEWPIKWPADIKRWEPETAVRFMFDYLSEKDRTNPPLSGSWVAIANEALASVERG